MSSDSKIEEFKKLIREHGIRKATQMIQEKGIVYSEDFTESHTEDPVFSSPFTPESTIPKIIRAAPLHLYYSSSMDIIQFPKNEQIKIENFSSYDTSSDIIETYEVPTVNNDNPINELEKIPASS